MLFLSGGHGYWFSRTAEQKAVHRFIWNVGRPPDTCDVLISPLKDKLYQPSVFFIGILKIYYLI